MSDDDFQSCGEPLYETPFDDADADLILHSSDGKRFRVFKVILRKASTFFATMFTLPRPRKHNPATPQIVAMSEDGETLERLLWMCYPMEEQDLSDLTLSEVTLLAAAADKYGMSAAVQRSARLLEAHAVSQALSVYAIATSLKLDAVARVAARACLYRPQSYIIGAKIPEMNILSLSAYQNLLQYHCTCTSTAVGMVASDSFKWINTVHSWMQCNFCRRSESPVSLNPKLRRYHPPLWWIQFMKKIGEDFQHNGPLAFSLRPGVTWIDKDLRPDNRQCLCTTSDAMVDNLRLMEDLRTAIRNAVYEVELKL